MIEKYTNLEIENLNVTVIATLSNAEHEAVKTKTKAIKLMHLPAVIDKCRKYLVQNINQADNYLKMSRLINR
jgi:hypothetical protein